MASFGTRLKQLREGAGLKQEHLASIIGKSNETVSKYELGQRKPDINCVISIAIYFNVSTDYLLGLNDAIKESDKIVEKPSSSEIKGYEHYLKDTGFIRYLSLAVKIKENGLNLHGIEKMINDMVRLKNQITRGK